MTDPLPVLRGANLPRHLGSFMWFHLLLDIEVGSPEQLPTEGTHGGRLVTLCLLIASDLSLLLDSSV